MAKPKITFLFTRYYPISNGVGNCTRAMAQALAQRGYQVDVITCRLRPDSPRYEILNGVRVHRILSFTRGGSRNLSILTFFLWEWLGLLRLLKKIKPDFVFGNMLFFGCVVDVLKNFQSYQTITHAHGSDVDEVSNLLQKLTVWWAIKKCDVVCATNTEFKEKMQGFYPRPDIHLLQNCIGQEDVEIGSNDYQFDPAYLHVVAAGRLVRINGIEIKGMSIAIEAMAHTDHYMLHVFGDGPYRPSLEDQARQLQVSDRILFYGETSHPQFCAAMQQADVLLFPSLQEGLSMTIVEACYLGLPIICTCIGGQRDYLQDNLSALFVQRGDAQSIREALEKFASSPELRSRLKQGARETFMQNFTYQAFVARFEELLRRGENRG